MNRHRNVKIFNLAVLSSCFRKSGLLKVIKRINCSYSLYFSSMAPQMSQGSSDFSKLRDLESCFFKCQKRILRVLLELHPRNLIGAGEDKMGCFISRGACAACCTTLFIIAGV
ncbi:unnamed protein product [Cuscuta epithymum]|uniref:Uncharacterized protein n=1 Tax=Cuscuta epithymum TaxID=186058 RepID=A0AAV0C8T3_9ASTE|nr:unnamed protein product [Cuscuta epithymum]